MSAQQSFATRHTLPASSEIESARSAIRPFQVSADASPIAEVPSGEERRRYDRIPLTVQGRYMLEDGREFSCQTLDVSPIGIGIKGFVAGAIGDRVIAYFDGLGRVEGKIVRRALSWFAIDISATPRKLERLADLIDRMAGNEMKGG